MQNVLKNQKPIVIAAVLAAALTAVAWQNKTTSAEKKHSDTIVAAGDTTQPRKRDIDKNEFGLEGLDEAMRNLERDMKRLGEEMKNLKLENIDKEIKTSLAAVDFEKMNKEIQASLKSLDLSKIQIEMSDKVRVEMDKSLKHAEAELKKVDLSKVKEEMRVLQEKLASEDFRMKIDGEKIRKSVEKGMAEAKEGMEKAKAELKNLRDFTNELENDGLINKDKGYKIQLKEGSLYINGKEQSKETTEKYKQYYKEKKNFTINMDGDNSISL